MRKTIRGAPIRAPIGFIILPMIDVIFLLLLFFVMVTSFEAAARIRVELPNPDHSQARTLESSTEVVINCEYVPSSSTSTGDALYRLGADPPEDLATISERITALRTANAQLTVVVRADRRLPFAKVRQVMQLAADNGIETVGVSALLDVEQ